MKTNKLLSLFTGGMMLVAAHQNSYAQTQFDQVIVFGASYLDSGTFPDFDTGSTTGLRFTNFIPGTGQRGSALSELLTNDLGLGSLLPAAPVLALGERLDGTGGPIGATDNINFAVGGFETEDILGSVTGEVSAFGFDSPGFNQRIASGDLVVSDQALFLVNLGGNDIRDLDDPQVTADASITILQELVNSGAQNIIALNLPNLGNLAEADNVDLSITPDPNLPFDPNNADGNRSAMGLARTEASIEFNALVDQGLQSIDANIIRADIASLFDEVLADPTAFGFSADVNQASECFNPASNPFGLTACNEAAGLSFSSGGNPDDFIFDDGLHPTQSTAQIAADYIESLLVAPGQIGLVAEAGYLALVQHQSSLRSELSARRYLKHENNSYRFFANISTNDQDIDATSSSLEADGDVDSGNIGFIYQYNDNWALGLALGYIDQEVDVDVTGTSFENDGLLFSALATYQYGKLFAEAGFTFTDLDIESDRGVTLGILQRVETGDTEGEGIGITFAAGYNLLNSEKFKFGPIVRLDFNEFDVDSFSEDGSNSTSLSFSNIERDAFIASIGAFANLQSSWGNTRVQYFGEISIEGDLEDDPSDIQASLNSLGNALPFQVESVDIDDSTGLSAQLGISVALSKKVNATLSYTYREIGGDINAINFGINADF